MAIDAQYYLFKNQKKYISITCYCWCSYGSLSGHRDPVDTGLSYRRLAFVDGADMDAGDDFGDVFSGATSVDFWCAISQY